ncbi:phosphotransferase family protein [Hydrocarboniphaga sp.]|uniref:phosphotransferase family protein n=1 Tax=Hydrocarboniphaga sp. TaxID=2033016 RepID=UPI00263196D6|nr:phosphotransferase family protein [Hydrocarboniphaga sp.]
MNTDEIGSGIVAIQRKARFADTSTDEWGVRLRELITSQPGISQANVSNVRQVGTAAGGSNGTLLFDADYVVDGQRTDKKLVLRFLPVKGLFHRYDVKAQFDLQKALETSDVPVPKQLWLDQEGRYLQRPGYVMEQVRGGSTPMTWMTSGLIADATPADRRKMTTAFVHALATIHHVDWKAAGLQWLERRATGSRPIEREVNWYWDALIWSKSSVYTDRLEKVRQWLIANEPTDTDTVLCHGDANLGNYLFEGTEITAVVDWEMAFLGSPECDLAFLKCGDQILQSETPWPEGAISYDEMYVEYERFSGRKLKHMDYFEFFCNYRMAVINVLAMGHFPPEVLESFMPVLRRGPELCFKRAQELGIL